MDIKPIHYSNLERKGIYIVETDKGIYKGMYLSQYRFSIPFPYIVLSQVSSTKNGTKYKCPEALFDKEDKFYDAEKYINEIKNKANHSRQQMESRALDKILKGIVNENISLVLIYKN